MAAGFDQRICFVYSLYERMGIERMKKLCVKSIGSTIVLLYTSQESMEYAKNSDCVYNAF